MYVLKNLSTNLYRVSFMLYNNLYKKLTDIKDLMIVPIDP